MICADDQVDNDRPKQGPKHKAQVRQHKYRRQKQNRVEAKLHPARLYPRLFLQPQSQDANPTK